MTIRRRLTLLATVLFVLASLCIVVAAGARAAVPDPVCTLTVPANPLTPAGLATPYQLANCDETNIDQAAFAEAAVLDPAGKLSVYHPLVVNADTQPHGTPVVPNIPAGSVVAIWFGSNADTLKVVGPGVVGGLNGDTFGQFAYINAPAFFKAAHAAIAAKTLTVPPLGVTTKGVLGKPCPTVRSFTVVDQDQSDNVSTPYWSDGKAMSQVPVAGWTKMTNGSDEGLLARKIDPALGCTPWLVPTLDGTDPVSSLASNELSAAVNQGPPSALVPLNDPMTLVNGHFSWTKTNLYRAGVDQPPLPAGQNPRQYCTDLQAIGAPFLAANKGALTDASSPEDGVNLFDFLTPRYANALVELGCKTTPPAPQHHRHRGHHHGHDD
jgi:hypothetical protein